MFRHIEEWSLLQAQQLDAYKKQNSPLFGVVTDQRKMTVEVQQASVNYMFLQVPIKYTILSITKPYISYSEISWFIKESFNR